MSSEVVSGNITLLMEKIPQPFLACQNGLVNNKGLLGFRSLVRVGIRDVLEQSLSEPFGVARP